MGFAAKDRKDRRNKGLRDFRVMSWLMLRVKSGVDPVPIAVFLAIFCG
jgi:hypothetical protein